MRGERELGGRWESLKSHWRGYGKQGTREPSWSPEPRAQSPGGAAPQQLCPTQRPQSAPGSRQVRSVCDRSCRRLDSQPSARLAPPTPTAALTQPIQQGPGAAQKGARGCLRPQPALPEAPRPFRPLQSYPGQLQTVVGAVPGLARRWLGWGASEGGRAGLGGCWEGNLAAGGRAQIRAFRHPVGPPLPLCKNAKSAFLLD